MNIIKKYYSRPLWFAAILLTAVVTGCNSSNDTSTATVTATDPDALTVISTNPGTDELNVATNRKIMATFSEPMALASLDDGVSFKVIGKDEPAIGGTVSLDADSTTAIFTHASDLTPGTVYTATITTAAASTSGKTMADDYVWSFTSGAEADIADPTVISTKPKHLATDFYLNQNIIASFDESLNLTTVDADSFTLVDDKNTAVAGIVSYNDKVATFNPDADLVAGVTYTATLTTDVEDLAGNALVLYSWTFSGTEVATTLLPVDLGTAGDFAVLAESAISTTAPDTMITGDIGLSPAAQTFITGFSEAMDSTGTFATSIYVTGNIYAADMTPPTPAKMTTAVGDMHIAYTDAQGRTLPDFTNHGSGDITSHTLAPGLYKWGTGVSIGAAGVTIAGSATDVWIFQIAGDLTVASAAIVTLADGALPENIFWQVEGGAGATIGTTAQFKGVVLAKTKIVVDTGATVNGRLLAQTAVTLDGNAVTQP